MHGEAGRLAADRAAEFLWELHCGLARRVARLSQDRSAFVRSSCRPSLYRRYFCQCASIVVTSINQQTFSKSWLLQFTKTEQTLARRALILKAGLKGPHDWVRDSVRFL